MRGIIAWGSYDATKPRVRLLLDALRTRGRLAAEINIPVWSAVRDKAVAGRGTLLRSGLRLLAAYPSAMVRLLRQPRRSIILLAYPAIPDIFFAWPVARLRRHKIVFDAFISLHDTVVDDRRLARPGGLAAKLLWGVEWLALRLADIVLVDTDQHGEFFAETFGVPRERLQTVLVGAEPAFWEARSGAAAIPGEIPIDRSHPIVLFYGQLIPLHGLDTILEAIRQTAGGPISWLLIGSGQDEAKLRRFLDEPGGGNVRWIPWVDYGALPGLIRAASVVLGIFGTSDKAKRVIPNKMFQVLAAGKPIITRASPAVDPISEQHPQSVITVPAGDGAALADAVRLALRSPERLHPIPKEAEAELGPERGVQALLARLDR